MSELGEVRRENIRNFNYFRPRFEKFARYTKSAVIPKGIRGYKKLFSFYGFIFHSGI